MDYNLFWAVGQNFNGNSIGSNNLSSDPMLTEDFRLRPGSPGIDAGAPGMTDSDGSPADLGAFGGDGNTSAVASAPTSTPKPTGTSTSQPTITPLPSSTPKRISTSTSQPTITPLPPSFCQSGETQLFASNFESGTSGWEFDPASAWTVVTDGASKVLQGTGHVHANHEAAWGDMIWRLKVKLDKGNVQLNFHWKDNQRYMVSFATGYGNLMKFPGGEFLLDA